MEKLKNPFTFVRMMKTTATMDEVLIYPETIAKLRKSGKIDREFTNVRIEDTRATLHFALHQGLLKRPYTQAEVSVIEDSLLLEPDKFFQRQLDYSYVHCWMVFDVFLTQAFDTILFERPDLILKFDEKDPRILSEKFSNGLYKQKSDFLRKTGISMRDVFAFKHQPKLSRTLGGLKKFEQYKDGRNGIVHQGKKYIASISDLRIKVNYMKMLVVSLAAEISFKLDVFHDLELLRLHQITPLEAFG
jgi:hypothetical protein